ncbi:MAG: iron-containing alcohol dehydrogenase [Thermoguttaceae bacterium]|nr:iron-containing alcohol dehydrogenase [Thermoguttaceae bacterium]MDW8039402.1 iron-containing alcohol dehydrogenase [Thermoguttaceae bacterium]
MRWQEPESYEFLASGRIVFGWGRRQEVGRWASGLGRRATIIYGSPQFAEQGLLDELAEWLCHQGITTLRMELIEHEPVVADVDRLAQLLRQDGVGEGDFLLAVGGGSAIDLAKAVAAMAVQPETASVQEYLEGVGRGFQLRQVPLPVMAMPTTAGTGAEATKNAVISSYDPPFKRSLRDDRLLPRLALIDPELTVSTPPAVTAASGMDAISQLIESYISCRAQPIPQALCLQGLQLAWSALPVAFREPTNRQARCRMAHAALLSGIALANSGLGFAHGVAAALGVHAHVPHGLACAMLLPTALGVNAQVRQSELAELAHLLLRLPGPVSAEAAVQALIEAVRALCAQLGLPSRLTEVGVRPEQIPAIVRDSYGSSMKGNAREVSEAELTALLEALL